jgi:diguanylate cyclase (GGDEF)-like protein
MTGAASHGGDTVAIRRTYFWLVAEHSRTDGANAASRAWYSFRGLLTLGPDPWVMPDPQTPNSPASTSRVIRLAVFHRSDDVPDHLAPLKQAPELDLILIWQGTSWTPPANVAGVLWELAPQDAGDTRISSLVAALPSASYSFGGQPSLADTSKALGFRRHLPTPLRLVDIERALSLPALVDLADRLETAAPRLVRLSKRTEAVGELMRAVNASSDPAGVAAALVSRVSDWLPLTQWSVLAVEPDGVLRRLDEPNGPAMPRDAGHEIAELVVRNGKAAVRSTTFASEFMAVGSQHGQQVEATVLGWPLVAAGEVIGVLVGFDHGRVQRVPRLSPELVEALSVLVEPAAYALSHALRVARAEALSVTDDLTQLYNSRFLNDALRKETKRAMRSGWPLSLLFIDLDGFKRLNDAHGHLLGSRALIEAAAIIRGSARETDIVARFGGDEFAILLPETGREGAHSVARRLRDRIQRYVFLADRGPGNRITASIGLATLPDVADTAEGLLQAADAAMYRVKVTGKNGIHIAGSDNTDTSRVTHEETELH